MTKVLVVSDNNGEDNFSALKFSESEISVIGAYNLANKSSYKEAIMEIDGVKVKFEALEFGEVDMEFLEFLVNNFIDFDKTDHKDFYIVFDEDSK